MATIIQQLKGTAAEVAAKTYSVGVLVWNETAKRWHGHDGVTAGGIAMARYDERNDGSLGYEQRLETAASNAVTVADIGKAIIGNRATAIAFNLDPAASLTSKFTALFKNIGAGAMTIVPNGAQLIDGANTPVTVPTGSSVILKGDGTSFRTFLSNGDVTGSAINNATALTGANLADNDKLGVYDVSAVALVGLTVAELISGLFKTARTIANAQFAAASFKLFNAAGTPRALLFNTTALTADRSLVMPDSDVNLGRVGIKLGTIQPSTSGTSVPFTGVIPSTANEITVEFEDVSLSGSDSLLIQLGTSSGYETAGYVATSASTPNGVVGSTLGSSAGFPIFIAGASQGCGGSVTLRRISGNKWSCNGVLTRVDASVVITTGGTKALAGVLDRLRVIPTGANNFDAGNINISWRE